MSKTTPYPSNFESKIIVKVSNEKKTVLANQFLQKINLKPINVSNLEVIDSLESTTSTDNIPVITNFIDARGLPCPQPLLKTKVALRSVDKGEYVYLLATDKNSKIDIQAYAKHADIHLYLEQSYTIKNNENDESIGNNDEVWHFLLSKSHSQ